MKKRGFTLLELLIVIGILSILTTVVAFVLNPAELLKQARDSQRLSDLNSLQTALGLYVASVDSLNLGACTAGGRCTFDPGASNGPFGTATCAIISTSTVVDGNGWIDVNLGSISSGSPLAKTPLDPKNDATYFYGYMCEETNYTFELDAKLESNKYRGLMTSDGGSKNTCSTYAENTCFYEIGTDPGLNI